jgi:hypothetical protein
MICTYEGTVLAASLDELITRDTSRSMRSLSQEINISRKTVGKMVSEEKPNIQKSPLDLPAWTEILPTTARGLRIG